MTSAIGIRVYQLNVKLKHKQKTPSLSLYSADLASAVPTFISRFIAANVLVVKNDTVERSWFFEQKYGDKAGNSRGYVHYGTFGFESNLIDAKTKERKYRRQTTDIEEIPLYYEFWFPEGSDMGFVAFQSFQGRSCIQLVMDKIKEEFDKENPKHTLFYSKLLPNDARSLAAAPVKRVRLISRSPSTDLADRYFGDEAPDEFDVELSISAKRKMSLGKLGSLLRSTSARKSVITYGGIQFPEAVADIRVGKKTRKVGVVGIGSDAGVIDLTDNIKRGADGHPTFKSLEVEVDEILRDFYETLSGAEE